MLDVGCWLLVVSSAVVAGDKVNQGFGVGWPNEEVHVGKALLEGGCILFDGTAHQGQDGFRATLFNGFEGAQAAVNLVLSALAHHAGVEDDDVGLLRPTGRRISKVL